MVWQFRAIFGHISDIYTLRYIELEITTKFSPGVFGAADHEYKVQKFPCCTQVTGMPWCQRRLQELSQGFTRKLTQNSHLKGISEK